MYADAVKTPLYFNVSLLDDRQLLVPSNGTCLSVSCTMVVLMQL